MNNIIINKTKTAAIAILASLVFALSFPMGAFAAGPSDTPEPTPAPAPAEVTENQVDSAAYTASTVDNAGNITIFVGKEYAGQTVQIVIASTPQNIATGIVDNAGNVVVSSDVIKTTGLSGSHTLAVLSSTGAIIGKAPVALNADGSVNVAATKNAEEAAHGSNGTNPVLPIGLALVLVAGIATAVVTRSKATN
ncbi:MAG: hypothetical protein LBN03_02290 [Bifidobacteriaceae bacterium]|jgi:hypothetical protein|nr:hypothetical protein [Bifidobacteriaceae bacterium]